MTRYFVRGSRHPGALSFTIPANTTVVAYGGHSALTAGTYYCSFPHNGTASKSGVGTVVAADVIANTITSSAHTLVNTDRIFVFNVFGQTLPAGLAEGVLYFVVGVAADMFSVSLTSGGAAVDITAAGEVAFMHCVPEPYASQATLTVSVGALDIDCGAF